MLVLDAKTMQAMDKKTIEEIGIPGLILMENAGIGCTDILLKELGEKAEKGILVVAGPGNNGGDGFVIARHLFQKGISVKVILLVNEGKYKGDALTNLKAIKGLGIEILDCSSTERLLGGRGLFEHAGIIVDAIFGTGLKRPVSGHFETAINLMNESGAGKFSVDIPSGLSSDSGKVLGTAFNAHVTCTMAFPKIGHVNWPGRLYTGRLFVIDIGIPRSLTSEFEIKEEFFEKNDFLRLLKPRPSDGHKGTFGHLLIIGGSRGKIGASCLCAIGALRSGAGLVTVASPRSSQFIISQKLTEAMTEGFSETPSGEPSTEAFEDINMLLEKKRAACIGPGLGLSEGAKRLCQKVAVFCPTPLVMDADSLTAIAECLEVLKEAKAPRILTPHPGEMARLCGISTTEVQEDRIGVSRMLSMETGAIVCLKGFSTVVASPDGRISINSTGNSGMGTGGMGDTLTGIIGALLCQGYDPFDAARLGVYAHGAAGDLCAKVKGPYGYLASEAAEFLPRIWQEGNKLSF